MKPAFICSRYVAVRAIHSWTTVLLGSPGLRRIVAIPGLPENDVGFVARRDRLEIGPHLSRPAREFVRPDAWHVDRLDLAGEIVERQPDELRGRAPEETVHRRAQLCGRARRLSLRQDLLLLEQAQQRAAIRSRSARARASSLSSAISPSSRRTLMSRAVQKPAIVAMSCVFAVASASADTVAGLNPPCHSRSKNITFDDSTPQFSSAGGTLGNGAEIFADDERVMTHTLERENAEQIVRRIATYAPSVPLILGIQNRRKKPST